MAPPRSGPIEVRQLQQEAGRLPGLDEPASFGAGENFGLIDELIAAAQMQNWVARRGPLSGADKFYQDFATSHGYQAGQRCQLPA